MLFELYRIVMYNFEFNLIMLERLTCQDFLVKNFGTFVKSVLSFVNFVPENENLEANLDTEQTCCRVDQ